MVALQGGRPLFKATLLTCVLNRCGLSLLQHAPRFSPPTARGLGPTRHASRSGGEEAKPAGSHTSCKPVRGRRSQTAARAVHATTRRLQALLHFRPDQRVKGRTAMQAACNRAKWARPFDSNTPSTEVQAHASCNWHAGCYVRATTPPLAPLPRLLDCGVNTATRGNPAVPAKRDGQMRSKMGRQ
jgi:hypothetical protein